MEQTFVADGGGTKLVIVESPAKARTISGFLGAGYVVESSIGHIRDLPNNAGEVPAKYKGESWGRLGVNVDDGFTPVYVVPADKKKQISKLKALLKDADELYLATDEDREGEAIAWHLFDELKPKVPVHRMVFHEITPEAIAEAVANPREINNDLVEAQEARRILDRLYGYEVSPVLWKKVMSGLSAGRVQSVATRLVVDRERERIAFRAAAYWDLEATFDAGESQDAADVPGQADERRRPPSRPGSRLHLASACSRTAADVVHVDGERAAALAAALREQTFTVSSVEAKPYRRSPYAPFRTTTLQQEASRKLGYGSARTMQIAQRLYENGHITYMRTDSVTLVRHRDPRSPRPGHRALRPRLPAGRSRGPTRARSRTPRRRTRRSGPPATRSALRRRPGLNGDDFRLYELIWMRTVASQMRDAQGRSVSVRIGATATAGRSASSPASGRVITFHGFLKAYVEGADDPEAERDDRETRLPELAEGDRSRSTSWTLPVTRPARRPATPRRRSSASSRSARSAGRRRTRRSSAPSSTAATSTRRAPRWCPPGWPSPSSGCWSGTSAGWSTTTSPRRWRTCSTRSPPGSARLDDGAGRVLLRQRRHRGPEVDWSPSSARSTHASCRRSSSARASRSGSAATGRTSRTPTATGPTSPRTCRPTS